MNSPLLLLVLTAMAPQGAEGRFKCEATSTCERKLRPGSVCAADGHCSNPFQSGCLRTTLGSAGFPYKRVCNSDDPRDASERGLCNNPPFEYDEVRISNQNWENPMTSTWIMQILLSELLQVPTTIETNSPELHYTFYDPQGRSDHSSASYPYGALRKAKMMGERQNCTLARGDAGGYAPCAHVLPMVNKVGQADNIKELMDDGIIGRPKDGGNFDQYRWWMPIKFAKQDPSLLSYLGIGGANEPSGESTRIKVAEAFKRPTTWGDYCALVSTSNCSADEGVAARAPGVEEAGAYFVDGLYTGHFRATDKNNCTANPRTCSGHISHAPCDWGNYAVAQAYHLGIPVSSDGYLEPNNGYGYTSLLEIYAAANATGSNVLMYWWEPDSLIEDYRGTDFELTPIFFPPTTKECLQSRPSEEERCSANLTEQVGDPLGSCDAGPVSNVIMMTLKQCEQRNASCSPAYSALQGYQLDNLDLQQILQYQHKDPNNDGREAVCRWFGENLETIKATLVPETYPRRVQNEQFYQPLIYFSLFLGALAVVSVILCAFAAKFYEKTKVMVYAQVDFLLIILSGLFLVATGAVLHSIAPTRGVCILRPWLVTVGYSLELIPLAVKVAAINRLFRQSKRFKRVEVKKSSLYKGVGCCIAAVCIYLATWTGLDPPKPQLKMTLRTEREDEYYVVEASSFCKSSNSPWQIATFVYLMVLLIMTAAVATQNRDIRQEFNESRYLCLLIYSHVVFIALRMMFFLNNKEWFDKGPAFSGILSVLLSLDTLIAVCIYFVPKVVAARRANGATYTGMTTYTRMGTSSTHGSNSGFSERRGALADADPASFVLAESTGPPSIQDANEQEDGYGDASGTGFCSEAPRAVRGALSDADPNFVAAASSRLSSSQDTDRHGDAQSEYDEFIASITAVLKDSSALEDVCPNSASEDGNPADKLVNGGVRNGATASGLERRLTRPVNCAKGGNEEDADLLNSEEGIDEGYSGE